MRFNCDHCGRTYAVADELSGRAFRMKCKACGESILVKAPSGAGAAADEPLTPVPPLSVLHAAEDDLPAAGAHPAQPPDADVVPEENPFVAQPVRAARAAGAVDALPRVAAPVPPAPPRRSPPEAEAARMEPVASVATSAAPSPRLAPSRADEVEDLRRSLADELAGEVSTEIEEFDVSAERSGGHPIGRLRDPETARPARNGGTEPRNGNGHARGAGEPRNGQGRNGSAAPAHHLADGEGAVALASFTEPARMPVAGPAARRQDLEHPEHVAEAAPRRPSRTPLVVGLGTMLAVGLAAGWLMRGKGSSRDEAPVAAAAPASAPAVVAPSAPPPSPAESEPPPPVPLAAAPPPSVQAPSLRPPATVPEATAAPDPAERAAQRKQARARRADVAQIPSLAAGPAATSDLPAPRGVGPGAAEAPATPPASRPTPATSEASAAGPAPEPSRAPVADSPRYMANGYEAPRLADRDCLSQNLRLPPAVAALASGPVTVRFAVYPGGKVEKVQVVSPVADPRIGEAVVRAVRACEWVAGSDADGNPTALWVVQPVRFAG